MPRSRIILSITVALLLSYGKGATAAIPQGALQNRIIELGGSGGLRGSVWGVLAVTADGDTLVNVRGNQRMLPASNLKLITTGAALCRLGPDFRFKTTLASSGEIVGGCLEGDLYIVGGGDPSLCDRYKMTGDSVATFATWRRMLEESGINGIRGRVRGDSRYFDPDNLEDSWCLEDICPDYSSGVSGLSIGDNLSTSPEEASLHCARQFTSYLRENGIPVSGEASDSPALPQDSLNLIGSTRSVRLRDLIKVANYESENIYAEAFFRQLGEEIYDKSDYEASGKALCSVLTSLGLGSELPEIQIVDGSGLSRKNYITPAFIVRFLRMMSGREEFGVYLESLPRPGYGTLKNRLKDQSPELRSRVYMKSGTMNGVRCFSGYILPSEGKGGKMIAFSIMTNNTVGKDSVLVGALDEMIVLLASEN